MLEKLPDKISEYIRTDGSDLLEGYIRFLNEDEVIKILTVVEKSELWNNGIPFATTVFGDVLTWENNYIMLYKFPEEDYMVILSGDEFFFSNVNDEEYAKDHFDMDLYKKVKSELGAINRSEAYTIEPIPRLGGAREEKYMSIGGLIEYLALLIM